MNPPRLFMAEIRVTDIDRSLTWYRDTLGLSPVLVDQTHGFALLDAGNARIALKERPDTQPGSNVRLVFEAEHLDLEHRRLTSLGVEPSAILENPTEGYREFRLTDPDQTPLTLFAWLSESTSS